jgi:predicted RNA-binding Zn ribbon-like protein
MLTGAVVLQKIEEEGTGWCAMATCGGRPNAEGDAERHSV